MSHQNPAREALIEQETRLRKRRRVWLALGIITLLSPLCALVALILLFLLIFVVPFRIAESRVLQSLNVYHDARFLYEDRARFGASTGEKSLYYWTESPMDEVKEYYEEFLPAFV